MKKKNTDVESLRIYLEMISNIPPLTRKEENYYVKRMQGGDDTAKNKIIEANLRFVVNIAKKHQGRGLSLADLIQQGNIGLVNATKNFDHNEGYFISYAALWIKQSIVDAIASKSRTIHLPVARYNELRRIEKELEKNPMRKPSVEEIAKKTHISEDDVKVLLQTSYKPVSLNTSTKNDDDFYPLIDHVNGSDHEYMQRDLETTLLGEDIQMTLRKLTKKEKEIIIHHFGLENKVPKTLEEIGKIYGLTRERIRQIQEKALEKIRNNTKDKEILEAYLT